MPSATAFAVGGIASAAADFDRAANQVASSASTPAYEVTLSSQAAGKTDPHADGDLAKSTVDMDVDKYRVAANARIIRTADEMVGTLLSIVK